jgi:nicotinamide-nucleotide amidase
VTDPGPDRAVRRTVEAIADLAGRHQLVVGVAESLTCGHLAATLGAGPEASTWLRGGIVAYASEVKFEVLGVTPGPVITERCAVEMARGVARVLDASATVAVTGVGGPDPEEGEPPGTVYVATLVNGRCDSRRLELKGEPPEVVERTTALALEALLEAISASRVDEDATA